MANKTQAKAAVDSASTAIKADIDSILPAGVDIVDGAINFAPTRWILSMNAANITAAETLATQIQTALTAVSRSFTLSKLRRTDDGQKSVSVITTLATYKIIFP